MDIEGTYTLQASPAEVWRCLMDEQVLRQALPGVERLQLLGEGKYDITLHIRQPPLLGTYSGQVNITESHYPYYYGLTIQGEGHQSTISGQGVVHLQERGDNTVVAYKGTLNIGRLGTLLPPVLVRGNAKLLLQQFFTELAEHLRTIHPTSDVTENNSGETILVSSPVTQSTLLRRIVRRLRLGGDDPVVEEQWVQRVRRTGIVSGLLLLVWIGTQLPKRLGL